MTSDDDRSTLEQFETLLAGLRKRQARCTFYVVPKTKLYASIMERWEADGHTFSVHPALEADTVRGMKMQEPQSRLIVPMLTRTSNAISASLAGRYAPFVNTPCAGWATWTRRVSLPG